MLRYPILILVMLPLMLVSAAKASVVPDEEHCVINVPTWDKLNIRSGPSTKSRVVIRKRYGSCGIMVVGNCQATWCPIEDGHMKGWANRRFLSMVSPSLYCAVNRGQHGVVKLRAFPSPQSRVLVALKRHTCGIAFLPYARNNWQKVRVNGWEGWVNRAEVSGQ
jgi:SH3-like domain-containing protein